jgi:hypothetical protein
MMEVDGVPFSDSNLTQALVTKWGLQDEPEPYRASITALILENYQRYFSQLAQDGQIPAEVAETFGASWLEDLYDVVKRTWRDSPLPDMFSIQPMMGPVGAVAYYQHRSYVPNPEDGGPEISIDIKITPITASARKTRALINAQPVKDGLLNTKDMLSMVFEELHAEITRGVLGVLLNSAIDGGRVMEMTDQSELRNTLERASNTIHKQTMRGPANNIIADKETLSVLGIEVPKTFKSGVVHVGALDGRWKAYFDPIFPSHTLMAWYQGPSILDTGIIYSPYRSEFAKSKDEQVYSIRSRSNTELVRPEVAYVIRPKVL